MEGGGGGGGRGILKGNEIALESLLTDHSYVGKFEYACDREWSIWKSKLLKPVSSKIKQIIWMKFEQKVKHINAKWTEY